MRTSSRGGTIRGRSSLRGGRSKSNNSTPRASPSPNASGDEAAQKKRVSFAGAGRGSSGTAQGAGRGTFGGNGNTGLNFGSGAAPGFGFVFGANRAPDAVNGSTGSTAFGAGSTTSNTGFGGLNSGSGFSPGFGGNVSTRGGNSGSNRGFSSKARGSNAAGGGNGLPGTTENTGPKPRNLTRTLNNSPQPSFGGGSSFSTNAGLAQGQGNYQDRYQALKKFRETERAEAIRDGFLADPDRPRSLADAITPVGTCPEMCPEFERLERITQNDVWTAETDSEAASGARQQPNEAKMVKKFRRAAAGIDEQLPSDLRPPPILEGTLDYLFNQLVTTTDSLPSVHHFVWDRTRAVRNDFSIQQVTKPADLRTAIQCYERIARFHMVSLHQLALEKKPYEKYDAQQEREQLDKTLLSLIQYYDDSRNLVQSPNEAEFRAYCIIFQIQDPVPDLEDRMQTWPPHVLRDARVQKALELYAAANNTEDAQGPLRPRTAHLIAQTHWARFWRLLGSNQISYLMACVAEIYLPLMRRTALSAIWNSYRAGGKKKIDDWTLDELRGVFGLENEDMVQEFVESYGFGVGEREDGVGFLELDSVSGRSLPDPVKGSQSQKKSEIVEKKRCGRTLSAVIQGLTVKRAREGGLIEEQRKSQPEDQEMEQDLPPQPEHEQDNGLFVEQYSDEEEREIARQEAQLAETKARRAAKQKKDQSQQTATKPGIVNFASQPVPESEANPSIPNNPFNFSKVSQPLIGSSETKTTTFSNPFNFSTPSQPLTGSEAKSSVTSNPFTFGTPSQPLTGLEAKTSIPSNPFNVSKSSQPHTGLEAKTSTPSNPFNFSTPSQPLINPEASITNRPFTFGTPSQPLTGLEAKSSTPSNPLSFSTPSESPMKQLESATKTSSTSPASSTSPWSTRPSTFLSAQHSRPNSAELEAASKLKESLAAATKEKQKSETLEQLAKELLLRPGGFLQQYIEYSIPSVIAGVREQVEERRARERADRFRLSKITRRYALRWKDLWWKKRLATHGRARRQRLAQEKEHRRRSRENSSSTTLADFRQTMGNSQSQSPNGPQNRIPEVALDATQHTHPPPTSDEFGNSLVSIPDAPSEPRGHKRRAAQANHRRTQSTPDQISLLDSLSGLRSIRQNRANRSSRLRHAFLPGETINQLHPAPNEPLPSDTTRSTYFKLKAMGITPAISTSSFDRKRPRSSGSDAAFSIGQFKRPLTNALTSAKSKESGAFGPKGSSTTNQEDDELFASVRKVREAMSESIAFYQEEVKEEEFRRSRGSSNASPPAPQTTALNHIASPTPSASAKSPTRTATDWIKLAREREAAARAAPPSPAVRNSDSPPAYRSRVSKFLPRERYADVLMSQRQETGKREPYVPMRFRPVERPRQEPAKSEPEQEIPSPTVGDAVEDEGEEPAGKDPEREAPEREEPEREEPEREEPEREEPEGFHVRQHGLSSSEEGSEGDEMEDDDVEEVEEEENEVEIDKAEAEEDEVAVEEDEDEDEHEEDEEEAYEGHNKPGLEETEYNSDEEEEYDSDEEEGGSDEGSDLASRPSTLINGKSGASVEDAIEL